MIKISSAQLNNAIELLVTYQRNAFNANDLLLDHLDAATFDECALFNDLKLLDIALDLMGFPADNVNDFDPVMMGRHARKDVQNLYSRAVLKNISYFNEQSAVRFPTTTAYVAWLWAQLAALQQSRPQLFGRMPPSS